MATTQQTLAILDQIRLDLDRRIDGETALITEAWARAWAELRPAWRQAIESILATQRAGKRPTRRQINDALRATKAMVATQDAIIELAREQGIRISATLPDLTKSARRLEADLLRSTLPPQLPAGHALAGITFDRLDSKALDAIVRRTTQQITALTRPLASDATAAMKSSLIRGVALGLNPHEAAAEMIRRVGEGFDGGRHRAQVIARTEMLDAHRAATAAQDKANTDLLTGWQWVASLTPATCPACFSMHGTVHPVEEFGPLGHQQCVLPGALISGPRALASTSRWYSGEVIDIETRDGRVLSVTPNHPILTPQGWVAAGLLCEGNDVVTGTGADGPAIGRGPHDHQRPALIEDVAQSVGGALPVHTVSVPTSPEDFHGDGAGSDVHVVRTDRLLGDDIEAAFAELLSELDLVLGNVSLPALSGGRGLALVFHGDGDPAGGGLGGLHDPLILFRGSGFGHGAIDLRTPADRHTCGLQSIVDRPPRHPIGDGQGIDGLSALVPFDDLFIWESAFREKRPAGRFGAESGLLFSGSPESSVNQRGPKPPTAYPMPTAGDLATFAGQVGTDCILKIRRRSWSGHVYNLQTETGWFLANGILTHNCRCARVPISKSWRDLGFDIPEPPSPVPDALSTFRAMSRDDQVAVLGQAKLDLLDSGRIAWSDLATRRQTDGWRDSMVPTPLADLIKLAASRRAA